MSLKIEIVLFKLNIDLESSSLYFFRTSTIRICAAKKKSGIVKFIDKKISVTDDNRNEIFTIHNAEQLMMMILCSIKSDDFAIDKHKQKMRQSVATSVTINSHNTAMMKSDNLMILSKA